MLRIEKLQAENFRCFDTVSMTFEPDVTLLFAENGGGKTALLTALAMGLGLLQPRHPKELTLNAERDARRIAGKNGGPREAAGPCKISWSATIGERAGVGWSAATSPTARKASTQVRAAADAIEQVRKQGARWPLMGHYGTGRFATERKATRKSRDLPDRWDGYEGCLEPSPTDAPLLEWLRDEAFGDLARHRRGEPERRFDLTVFNTLKRVTPGVADIWYDPAAGSPMVRFEAGNEVAWEELSDGFHMFLALVGDIARRAVILNSQDGLEAPLLVEGVVLIDELDLHLHPRWQRDVLKGLRTAFPKLQFIITTHSPQVLSSAENRQVRQFVDWDVKEGGIFVEGRDTNAILVELMGTDNRDETGRSKLDALYEAIDDGRISDAQRLLTELRTRWGQVDPELIRAEGLLDLEE
ncbi:SMC domain protein [Corallococcus macrosporus]|uniref:SMC domain protein n=2 Tax=Myxococcaceae TaxID=31 RepID=F8CA97_MYXFH|nr:SMC domain protein [Corallococcus macrosporus]